MTGRTGPARSRTNLRHEFDMRYDEETRKAIYAKTNGLCHLCWKPIAFSNYGAHGTRGAWEVDHSVPVSEGGTDHLNNLFSSHTACNRSKQAASSLSARRVHGKTRAPMSAARVQRARIENALIGAFAAGLCGARFGGPVGFWIGAIIGGLVSYETDPEVA